MAQPTSTGSIPYEYAASLVSAFPNCVFWCNLPYTANDACLQAIAQKVAATIGPTNSVALELGNEHWNPVFTGTFLMELGTAFPSYLPTGTTLFPFTNTSGAAAGYTVTNGISLPNSDATYTLWAAHAYDVFEKAWLAAGMSASRIKRVFGSWWSGSGTTANIVSTIATYGIPADYIAVGAYANVDSSPSFAASGSPAGSPGSPGNWPVDAINDYYRHQMFFTQSAWTWWEQHSALTYPAGLELVVYEGAVQAMLPPTAIDYSAVGFDAFNHPSFYDAAWCYFLALQQGNPTTLQGGAVLANYFSLYGPLAPYTWTSGTDDLWLLSEGACQPPGYGSSNQYLTSQGGPPGTRFPLAYAQYNDAVGLQAVQDWVNVTTPSSLSVPTITWANPANITYGTALSGTQLDATASVPGTFTYTPAAGTVLGAGNNQTLSVSFVPTDTTDYTSATATVEITVLQATPTITWANPANITYGTALSGTQLNATASVSGTFTYTPAAGTVLGAGNNQTLSVSFVPYNTTDYTSATAAVEITVLQATPTDTSLTPSPGATGISQRVVIVVQFNEPMLGTTITGSTFTLTQGGTSIAGTVAYNLSTYAATFTPTSILAAAVTYTATVTTGVTNASGTALATPIGWSFTTAATTVNSRPRWYGRPFRGAAVRP